MCYFDGSTTDPIREVCPPIHEGFLDCGYDDYFNVNPAAGQLPRDALEHRQQLVPRPGAVVPAPGATGAPDGHGGDGIGDGDLGPAGLRRRVADHRLHRHRAPVGPDRDRGGRRSQRQGHRPGRR